MPGGDGGITFVEGDTERFCGGLTRCGGGVRMEDGGWTQEGTGGAPCCDRGS